MLVRAIVLLIVGLPSSLDAQQILGRVIDSRSKLPIPGVSIELLADSGGAQRVLAHASADSMGLFFLNVPTPGRYRLAFNVGDREAFVGAEAIDVAGEEVQREFALPHVWLQSEVDKKAAGKSGGGTFPRYPTSLRMRNQSGVVCGEFVVDTSGRVLMSTFKALESTDSLFTEAVRKYLAAAEFLPAEVHGRKVALVVRMPFVFSIGTPDPGPAGRALQSRCR